MALWTSFPDPDFGRQLKRSLEHREKCGRPTEFLCDRPMGDMQTCDMPCCQLCATEVGEDLHLCRFHSEVEG